MISTMSLRSIYDFIDYSESRCPEGLSLKEWRFILRLLVTCCYYSKVTYIENSEEYGKAKSLEELLDRFYRTISRFNKALKSDKSLFVYPLTNRILNEENIREVIKTFAKMLFDLVYYQDHQNKENAYESK